MKTRFIILTTIVFMSGIIATANDDNKQVINSEDCRGNAFFIGMHKDKFVGIFGGMTAEFKEREERRTVGMKHPVVCIEQQDTIGGKLLTWKQLGIKLYVDNKDLVIDYWFTEPDPNAELLCWPNEQ